MQFLIMLVLLLIIELTRPTPASPRRPGLNEFQVTTVDQSRRIPLFWGTCWLKGPNLVWYGDLRIEKVKEKIKGIFKSKTYTVGYKYYLGFHLVFGRGGDGVKLLQLNVGNKEVLWTGSSSGGAVVINKAGLWGGDKEGGGIQGTCEWLPGGPQQGPSLYLKKKLGEQVPAWRGVCSLVGQQVYLGTSTMIRQWQACCQYLPSGLDSGYSDIQGDANPMEILYELLVDKQWGIGVLPNQVDLAALRSNAARLHEEGMGISLSWDGPKTFEDIMKEIDRHIDSITYFDPVSRMWTCKLIRNDYTVASLEAYSVDPSNAELTSFARPTADELVNEVKVVYSSSEYEGDPVPIQVQDTAGYWNRNNQKVSSEQSYPGFRRKEIAARVAMRDLRALGYPFARLQLQLNRNFHWVRQGSRLLFNWPPLNISNMPIIVLERDMGTLADGKIQVVAVQDVFGVGQALYEDTDDSAWERPSTEAKNPTSMRMEFTPYWFMLLDSEVPGPTAAVPMIMVESPSEAHYGYDVLYTDPAIGTSLTRAPETEGFTPTAVLLHDYLETASPDTSATLVVGNLNGIGSVAGSSLDYIRQLGRGLIIIDSELMAVEGAYQRADGAWALSRVHRGLLDTVVARHLVGAKVWFISEGLGRTPTELLPFAQGTYKAKIVARARGGVANEATAPVLTLTTNGTTQNARPLYDYPPRAVTLNGSSVPSKLSGTAITVAWKFSNKVAETTLKTHDDLSGDLPGGAKTRASLHNSLGTQLAYSGDVFSNSYTFSVGDLPGGLPEAGYVKVWTTNGVGDSVAAVLWFGRGVDYASQQDQAPQRLLDEANPWMLLRMSD